MSEPRALDPDERRRYLIAGMVGDEHTFAYRNSAEFRASVDTLAKMLPLWVDAMAEQAGRSDAVLRQRLLGEQILTPVCLCSHRKVRHTGDNACLDCKMPHPFSPRWLLAQCPATLPEYIADKTGVPVGSQCLKEDSHVPAGDGHVAMQGEQWVSWA